ncbi:MAG: DUF4157 domain-containing protein [Tateyamaria sp.]|jgi:hypothetical protein|uniref:eCIS core domain-containing protein n=1 Tax=unclassified Tateyamaria TaxID=2645127 RepID=UPI000D562939|nr:DUF4157 domain-containing protein [Tateyamaria sp. Alg231-49]
MADDPLKKIKDKLKGKKAKLKSIKKDPEETKSVKLDQKIAKSFQESHGADLSKVKVHSGGNAPEICKELGAKAFTQGNNLFVAKAGDAKNMKLLAHELTHVVQQGGGSKMPKETKGKVLVSK